MVTIRPYTTYLWWSDLGVVYYCFTNIIKLTIKRFPEFSTFPWTVFFLQTVWPHWGVLTVTVKARCSIEVVSLVSGFFPVNFQTKSLLWNVHVHFDCAASHKTRHLMQKSCQETSYRELVQRSCQETSYEDLVQRSCQETSYRDLDNRVFIYRDFVQRSCQETSYQRSCTETWWREQRSFSEIL